MGMSVYTSKPTIPVRSVDTVPSGAIGVDTGGWLHDRRIDLKYSRFGCGERLDFLIEERVELGELQLDGG
jgi:hypothetical protein